MKFNIPKDHMCMRRISVCFLSIARKHSPFQNYCVSKPIIQIPYVLEDFEISLTTEGTYLIFRQLVNWKDYKTKTMTTRKNNYCSQSKNNHSKSWKSKDNQITNKVDSASLAISACSCAMVGFIYTFWYSLSSTSSILE